METCTSSKTYRGKNVSEVIATSYKTKLQTNITCIRMSFLQILLSGLSSIIVIVILKCTSLTPKILPSKEKHTQIQLLDQRTLKMCLFTVMLLFFRFCSVGFSVNRKQIPSCFNLFLLLSALKMVTKMRGAFRTLSNIYDRVFYENS